MGIAHPFGSIRVLFCVAVLASLLIEMTFRAVHRFVSCHIRSDVSATAPFGHLQASVERWDRALKLDGRDMRALKSLTLGMITAFVVLSRLVKKNTLALHFFGWLTLNVDCVDSNLLV